MHGALHTQLPGVRTGRGVLSANMAHMILFQQRNLLKKMWVKLTLPGSFLASTPHNNFYLLSFRHDPTDLICRWPFGGFGEVNMIFNAANVSSRREDAPADREGNAWGKDSSAGSLDQGDTWYGDWLPASEMGWASQGAHVFLGREPDVIQHIGISLRQEPGFRMAWPLGF